MSPKYNFLTIVMGDTVTDNNNNKTTILQFPRVKSITRWWTI